MSKASSLRVGVIGTGAFAEACHLPGLLSHPQAAVVGICGRQFSRTKTVADRFGVPFATSDPAELCAHPEVDAITICTPTAFHLEHALLAIEHGKHVFCEKPLACTVGEAESMTAAAKAAGQLHQVAFTFRHLFGVTELVRRVKAGDVGEPYFLRVHHEYQDGHKPEPAAGWRHLPGFAGGVLYETGSHLLDVAQLVLGHASAIKADLWSRPGVGTEDIAIASLHSASGAIGHLFASRVTTPRTPNHVQVMGRDGTLETLISRGAHDALRHARRGEMTWEELPLPEEARDGQPHALGRMMRSFVNGCLRGCLMEGAASFDDGLTVQRLIAAAEKSSEARNPIQVPLPQQFRSAEELH